MRCINRKTCRKHLAVILLLAMLSALLLPPAVSSASVLTWPKGAEIIQHRMFYGNTSLESVVIPEGVKEIREEAFANSSLREITLPSTITFIDESAFAGTNLTSVHAVKGTYAYNWMRERGCLAEYRALVIGEKTFLEQNKDTGAYYIAKVLRNEGDANQMQSKLNTLYGATGNPFSVVKKTDLSSGEILSAIQSTFADTMDQDVSLFFIASHGYRNSGDLLMPYLGSLQDEDALETYSHNSRLSFETLASWLTTHVKGKVIVILESCGSGAAVYSSENGAKGTLSPGMDASSLRFVTRSLTEDTQEADAAAFTEKAVEAFGKADPGVAVVQPGTKSSPAGMRKASGSFRQPKFYVLASCAYNEDCYGYANTSSHRPIMNFFTLWLLQGIGKAGASPADTIPKNGVLTLQELFLYIYTNGKYNGKVVQHVQCYPSDSGFECFLLKK